LEDASFPRGSVQAQQELACTGCAPSWQRLGKNRELAHINFAGDGPEAALAADLSSIDQRKDKIGCLS